MANDNNDVCDGIENEEFKEFFFFVSFWITLEPGKKIKMECLIIIQIHSMAIITLSVCVYNWHPFFSFDDSVC